MYLDIMRQVQSISAILFFVLVHIPLSREHSLFCFVTALLPMMLNIKTKYAFYEMANKVVCIFFNKDPEAKNHI